MYSWPMSPSLRDKSNSPKCFKNDFCKKTVNLKENSIKKHYSISNNFFNTERYL